MNELDEIGKQLSRRRDFAVPFSKRFFAHDDTFETTFIIAKPLVSEKLDAMSTKPLKQIGIWSGIWGFVRAAWISLGVWGNFQTSWDIWHGWPVTLQNIAWSFSTWWFPIIICTVCLLAWFVIEKLPAIRSPHPEAHTSAQNESTATNVSGNVASASAGGDVHQSFTTYQGAPASSPDDPHPRLVALDDLRELLREGDKMIQDFNFGEWEKHPLSNVNEYADRVRKCVRRTVLAVPDRDWMRFEQPLEQDAEWAEVNALCNAKLIPDILINPDPTSAFLRLTDRVERLRELLESLTGVKIESQYIGGPASINPKRTEYDWSRDAQVPIQPKPYENPDRLAHEEYERSRAAENKEVVLRRNVQDARERAENLLVTVASRIKNLNELVDGDAKALEAISKMPPEFRYQATKNADPSELFEIDKEIITEALQLYRDKDWSAFHDLWQACVALNREIEDYNTFPPTAEGTRKVRKWTIQNIPSEIAKADNQSSKPLS